MQHQQKYTSGDRVRLACDCLGGYAGEEGRVVAVKRDREGAIVSLTVLFDGDPRRTRGTSLYPHEVEPASPNAPAH